MPSVLSRARQDAASIRALALYQRLVEMRSGCHVRFAAQLLGSALDDPQCNHALGVMREGIGNRLPLLADMRIPFFTREPVKKMLDLLKVLRALRDLPCVQPVGLRQRFADTRAIEPLVGIGRVAHRLQSGISDDLFQLSLAPIEQRPRQSDVGMAGQMRLAANSRQPAQPAPPIEPHQQSLGLIIGMMSGQDRGNSNILAPLTQGLITRRPGIRLKVAGRHIYPQIGVIKAQFGAN